MCGPQLREPRPWRRIGTVVRIGVDDGWTSLIGKMLRLYLENLEGEALSLPDIMDLANLEKMNELRARIEALVEDPNTSEALKPWYRMFCKRPCFHDQYLQTFNRDNVTLVDTEGQGVERITESGVVVAGVEYPVDCIVYATGFEVGTGFQRVSGFEIYGRDGLSLSDKWADGIRTLHGMHIHGFPNCFLMSTIQGGFTVNYPHMLDEVATPATASSAVPQAQPQSASAWGWMQDAQRTQRSAFMDADEDAADSALDLAMPDPDAASISRL